MMSLRWFSLLCMTLVTAVIGSPLFRNKRQLMRPPRTSPSPALRRLLEDFWPSLSNRCPAKFMLCRDESFCFSEDHMCGGEDICRDSSDDINAYCLGVTSTSADFRTVTTSPATRKVISIRPSNSAVLSNEFSHPLVVAFFALIAGLFVYVSVATICCVTHRWNSINPTPLTT